MEVIYVNIELILLLILGIFSLWIKNRVFNLKLIKFTFIGFLIINPLQLLLNTTFSTLLINFILIFFSELIVVQNLISIIIKPNLDRLFQGSFVMITTSLIGIIFAVNVLIIAGWFASLLFFILINYFTSGESKVFNEYLPITISFSTSIIVFFIFSLFFIIFTSNYFFIGLNTGFEIYLIILIFTVGTFGGIFPFNLLLDKFFKDSDFQTLNIYMIIQYSLLFFFIHSLFLLDTYLFQFGLIFLIISILGLLNSFYSMHNELFFNFGRRTISLRKLLGTLFIMDFNNVIFLSSLLFFTNLSLVNTFLNYIFFAFLAKFVLIVPLQYKLKGVDTDDLNKIGNLYQEERFLGVSALFSGLITAFPSSFLSFYIILNSLFSYEIQSNIIILSVVIIILVIHSVYVLTNIIGITSISIKVNFNKEIMKVD